MSASEIVSFVAEHYGGNIATMMFIAIISWKWSKKYNDWNNRFDKTDLNIRSLRTDISDMKKERQALTNKNDSEHAVFCLDIGNLQVSVARIEERVK